MLVQKYTRLFLTEHRKVETGSIIREEGVALVNVVEGNETVVKPSTGASNEVFAGIAMTRNSPPEILPWVGEGVVPASGAIELPRLPLAGQVLVKVEGTKVTVGAGAPADATAVQLAGQVVTFHADHVGASYSIQMAYEPTLSEARQILGDAPIGGISASYQGVTGVITRGEVATTFFDASADFAGQITPRLGPDGRFTIGGTGTLLTNVQIISAPSAENAALVLRVNV